MNIIKIYTIIKKGLKNLLKNIERIFQNFISRYSEKFLRLVVYQIG